MLSQWRKVVDKYTEEFNVSVLHDDGLYLDLLENMVNFDPRKVINQFFEALSFLKYLLNCS